MLLDRIRTIDEATPRERQRIFALLDRCGLRIIENPPDDMGVVYVTLLPWRAHGKRWAYLGRSKSWCLRYLGSGVIIKAVAKRHPRGEFIKVCVGVAENGPPLVALEEALQIKAGVRRTREDTMHRDWLNVVAHGGGAGKGATLWTKAQQARISSLGGKSSGPINGRRNVESGQLARMHADPEWQRKNREALARIKADPEWQRANKEHLARLHADPGWQRKNREALARLRADPEWQRKNREALARLHIDPDWLRRNRARLARMHADPDFQRIKSEALARVHAEGLSSIGASRSSLLYRTNPAHRARIDSGDPKMWASAYPDLPEIPDYNGYAKGAAPRRVCLIVPVARPRVMNPENGRGRRLRLAYECGTTSVFVEAFSADSTLWVSGRCRPRECLGTLALGGFLSLVHPETGAVVFGPGHDQETLRHTGAGWRRGRVVSRGPYGLPGGPLMSP